MIVLLRCLMGVVLLLSMSLLGYYAHYFLEQQQRIKFLSEYGGLVEQLRDSVQAQHRAQLLACASYSFIQHHADSDALFTGKA